jgi:hypothetical protein
MGKKKIVFGIAAIFLIACAGPQVEYREATDYNFLDFGSYKIEIDKSFEFVGSLEKKRESEYLDGTGSSRQKITRYIFTEGKSNIKRGIIIYVNELTTPGAFWRGEASFDKYNKPFIIKGRRTLGDIKCAFLARKGNKLSSDLQSLINEKGYRLGKFKCGISLMYAKTIGTSRMIHVLYFEGIEENCDKIGGQDYYSIEMANWVIKSAENCLKIYK